ncbi:MAG: hypothetical protein KJO98_01160 [Rhodothermia bacterium]|nr:hypothetical protein [Rhodothermia bacterium]
MSESKASNSKKGSKPDVSAAVVAAPGRKKSAKGVLNTGGYCTHCGSPFPEGARFCGACGEKIVVVEADPSKIEAPKQDDEADKEEPSNDVTPAPVGELPSKSDAAVPTRAATDRELGRQVLIVVGAGVLLVVGLFFITLASKNSGGDAPPPTSQALVEVTPEPLPADLAATASILEDEIDRSTGEEKRQKQGELVDFYVIQSRLDLAAQVQDSVAHETGSEVDWIRAGNLYYDWMEGIEGPEKGAYAKKAIASYQEALALNPSNHDVRTDMAIAYMYDPENGMQAIAETNKVLEENPEHVQANFNKGIMLLRIGRHDEAGAQFEKVQAIIGDSTNQIYQRAEAALQAVEQLRAG